MDDILFAAKTDHTEQLVEALQGAWTCSPAEFVTKEGSMLLFGFGLSMEEDGAIRLSQEGFMREMVKRRVENHPCLMKEMSRPWTLKQSNRPKGMVAS